MSAPIIGGRVRRTFARPAADVVAAIGRYPSGIVSDCLNRMGIMDAAIRPIVAGRPFCGPALTVNEVEGGNLMSHVALELVQPGDVLVIDAKATRTRAAWGGIQTLAARERGAAAVVINGCVRDVEDVDKLGLPLYALGASPGGPLKGWGGDVNLPIACAGVPVCPGDVVRGDDDGVVVIPREVAAELPELCEARTQLEAGWTERVAAGETTLDTVGLRSTLERMNIRYEEGTA